MPSMFRSPAQGPLHSPEPPATQHLRTCEAELAGLFRSHYQNLCGFVHSYVRSRAVAEELVQELFLEVWERMESGKTFGRARGAVGPGSLVTRSYLFTAARNRALSHLRRERLHTRWVERAADEETSNTVEAPRVDATMDYAVLCRRVEAEVARLSPRCRVVFTMHRQQEMSYAEIAGHLGISVKAVEAQMGRALKALRRTILPLLAPLLVFLIAN
jgi:RNA polymerase sigma-70 factor (ECF subfamily)